MAHDLDQNKGSLTVSKNSRSFLDEIRQFHKYRGTPFYRVPQLAGRDVDLCSLYRRVIGLGGWLKVTNENKWEELLPEFRLPRGCTNGGTALKHLYIRYLDLYEKIHFLGSDPSRSEQNTEDETPTRKKPTSSLIHGVPLTYNHQQHHVSDYKRTALGMCLDLHERNPYHNLIMSLTCGLPNEIDFALNVCMLLSNEGKHSLKLRRSNNLLALLLAHVGLFDQDASSLSDLHHQGWMRYTRRDFGRFWFESTKEECVLSLIRTDKTIIKTDMGAGCGILNLSRDMGVADVESQRVIQLAVILRNLSFDGDNGRTMANNTLVFRFLLLCTYNRNSSLKQLALDALGNLAIHIKLTVLSDEHTNLLLKTVWRCLSSTDKFDVVRGLEILGKLCQTECNEDALMEAMERGTYEDIVRLLTVLDIQLIVFTLEALYQLSELGEASTTQISGVRHAVEMLVNLVTIEAQSYGTQSLVGIKVVEYINAPQATTSSTEFTPTVTQPDQNGPSNTPVAGCQPSTPAKPTPPPSAAQSPALPASNSNEVVISNWLKQGYETHPSSEILQLPIYSDYLAFCNNTNASVIVGAAVFGKCIKLTFPMTELKAMTRMDGKKEILVVGLRKRDTAPKTIVTSTVKIPSVLSSSECQTPKSFSSNTLRQRLSQPPLSPNLFPHPGPPADMTPKSSLTYPQQPVRCVTPPTTDSNLCKPISRHAVSRLERRFEGCSQNVKDTDGSTNLIKSLLAKKLHRNSGTRPIQPKPPPPSTSATSTLVDKPVATAFPVVYATANVANVSSNAGIINFGVVCGPQLCTPQTQLCTPQTQLCAQPSPVFVQQKRVCAPPQPVYQHPVQATQQTPIPQANTVNSRQFRNIAPHPSHALKKPLHQPILPNPSTVPFHNQYANLPNQTTNSTLVENPSKKSAKRKRSKSPATKPQSLNSICSSASSLLPLAMSGIESSSDVIDAGRLSSEIQIERMENKSHQVLQKQLKKHKLTRAQITRNRLKLHRDGKLSGIKDNLPSATDLMQGILQVDIGAAMNSVAGVGEATDSSMPSIVVNLDMSLIERMPAPSPNSTNSDSVREVVSNLVDAVTLSANDNDGLLQTMANGARDGDFVQSNLLCNNSSTVRSTKPLACVNQLDHSCENHGTSIAHDQVPSPVVNGRCDESEDFPPSPIKHKNHGDGGLLNGICDYTDAFTNKRQQLIESLKKSQKLNGIANHINQVLYSTVDGKLCNTPPGDLKDSYIVTALNADLMNRDLLRKDNESYINGISDAVSDVISGVYSVGNGALEAEPGVCDELSLHGVHSVVTSQVSSADRTEKSQPEHTSSVLNVKIDNDNTFSRACPTAAKLENNEFIIANSKPTYLHQNTLTNKIIMSETMDSKANILDEAVIMEDTSNRPVAFSPTSPLLSINPSANPPLLSINPSTNTSFSSPITISVTSSEVGTSVSPPFSPDKSSRDSCLSPDLASPTISDPGSGVAAKSPPSKKRVRPKARPRTLGTDGKPLKPSRSRKRSGRETGQGEVLLAPAPPVMPPLQLACEWNNCNRIFTTAKAVTCHMYAAHLRCYAGSTCLWPSCDQLARSKWSLTTHVQDHHCNAAQLMARAKARLKEVPETPAPTTEPAPPPLVYPPDAAMQAIRRFAARPPYPQLLEPREGPVTKHIRLTSALILRNLARYSATGRSQIKRYEQRLSYTALSTVESSDALSNCLWAALHDH